MMAETHIYDTIVIGAGISGLTAAFRLQQGGQSVLVLEASDQPGGIMQSGVFETPLGKAPVEFGPNTVPASAAEFLALAQEVGLSPIESSPDAKKRYLFLHERLTPLPSSLLSFLTSPVLSPLGKMAILQDFYTPVQSKNEITIADFFEKRFGKELLDNIITPALTGIYAGNPETMSLQATFPFLSDWERESRSVIKGAINALKKKKRANPNSKKKSTQHLISFEQGMGQLPQAIVKALGPDAVRFKQPVKNISTSDNDINAYHVETDDQRYCAKRVIIATCADKASNLLMPLQEEAANILKNIPYAPMNLVYLGFEKSALPFQWDGFGFLVPRKQTGATPVQLLGSIWNSCLFPERYPSSLALATHFQGGMFHPETSSLTDEELIQKTIEELRIIYRQPSLTPIAAQVKRWPKAIPQYTLGHRERIEKASALLSKHCPGISLLGNYQSGVSLNDCVKRANALAASLLSP